MLNCYKSEDNLPYPDIGEVKQDLKDLEYSAYANTKQIKKLKQIEQEKIMGNIIFKEESGDIKALRAIKPLAIEIQEKEDIGFASALNKAAIELGFKNYNSYKKDAIANN